MVKASRIVLVVLGLALVVYGTASLTGGWLGTPPWWECGVPYVRVSYDDTGATTRRGSLVVPCPGRVRHSVAIAAAGLAVVLLAGPRPSRGPRSGSAAAPTRLDARKLLFVPSWVAAATFWAATSDDWYTVVVSLRGPLGVLRPPQQAESLLESLWIIAAGVLVLLCVLVPIVKSVRRPSLWWAVVLVPAWLVWLWTGLPVVWRT